MAALSREQWQAASPHLERAIEMDVEERRALLAELRSRDPALAADVEALLEECAEVKRERFLEGAPPFAPEASLAGLQVGAYTLISQIGQGGAGGVWLARRSDGRFQGLAAVKLLNPGLVGRAGEERFRREGTFLARLAHPHIARLLDAGVSPTGQPYLVLEHVDGEPIDRYCDARALDVEARVRLFLDVLAAVAHAHANLIVHRDIKPSNVLVGRDGRVRLLDFGIAKLIEPEAGSAEATELTRDGGRALTPEYAAPEQLTGSAITTATDVYALGVLLYLLLSGKHPAESGRRSTADLVRAVVSTEPRRLSEAAARTTTTAVEGLPGDATSRSTTAEGLRRLLKGDLETVVAKALKKRPEERYESVGAFADDLQRYLRSEPVRARPDTLGYRGARFARRHAGALAVAAGLFVMVSGLVAFYTVRLATERDRARIQASKATQVSRLLTELFTRADPFVRGKTAEPSVRELLDAGAGRIEKELAGQPDLQAEMLNVMGRVYQRLGVLDKAQGLLERGLAAAGKAYGPSDVRVAETLNNLGVVLDEKGDFRGAATVLQRALDMRQKLLGRENADVAVTLVELARAYEDQGNDRDAEPLFREALAIRRKLLGEDDHETATSENDLALLLWRHGDVGGAEPLFRKALATDRKVSGEEHPDVATMLNNLALISMERRDFAAGETFLRQAVAIARKTLPPGHPDLIVKLCNLANALREQGKGDEASSVAQDALDGATATLAGDNPLVATCEITLALAELARGRPGAAEALLRRALASRERSYPAADWRIASVESALGEALTAQRRYDEAEHLLVAARGVLRDVPGREGRAARENQARLAALEAARRPSQ